ncbi:MAG: hypothetical protein L0216_09490 [Planctomycetales bacterium]|nr:hypothetical protein [Planctomycetales bacterium]
MFHDSSVVRRSPRPDPIGGVEALLRRRADLLVIEEEQEGLVAGRVSGASHARRLRPAAEVSEACQEVAWDLRRRGLTGLLGRLGELRDQAERILRENPLLQARGALDVVRFRDSVPRHVINSRGERERRTGWGLHRRIRNDEGPSVVLAITRPGYRQLDHHHPVPEYTLVADSVIGAHWWDGRRRDSIATDGEILHFAANTTHALVNIGRRPGRTLTVKYPLGLKAWIPVFSGAGRAHGTARVLRPVARTVRRDRESAVFEIEDECHGYSIELIRLAAGAALRARRERDDYPFVLAGTVEASGRHGAVRAGRNDVLAIRAGMPHALRAGDAGARLYRVEIRR